MENSATTARWSNFTQAGVSSVEVLDPASDKIVAQIPTGISPHFVGYPLGSAFGIVVVHGRASCLCSIRRRTSRRATLRSATATRAATFGDGKTTYVTNEGSNDVTVVDLATGRTAAIAVANAAPKAVVQQAAAASVEVGAKVSIVNFAFTPAEITIAPGESVTWTNDDGAPHGLAYHDGAKGTDLMLPGATFSRRFDQPGTYDYNCAVQSLYDRSGGRTCQVMWLRLKSTALQDHDQSACQNTTLSRKGCRLSRRPRHDCL